MSNMNSFIGYQNLPAQVISVNTESTLLVPAQGLYSTLPSPTLAAGAGLYVGIPSDVLNNATFDGHPFTVRVAGKANIAATACTLTTTLRLGTSATAASNTQIVGAAAVGSSLTAVGTNFWFEGEFIWDSVSATLNGYVSGCVGGALKAPTVITGLQVANLNATTPATFNFIPSFTFSVANAANSVTVTEFLIDRGV